MLRGFGANGFDADISVGGGLIRCETCGETSSTDGFGLEDGTPVTDELRGADVVRCSAEQQVDR